MHGLRLIIAQGRQTIPSERLAVRLAIGAVGIPAEGIYREVFQLAGGDLGLLTQCPGTAKGDAVHDH